MLRQSLRNFTIPASRWVERNKTSRIGGLWNAECRCKIISRTFKNPSIARWRRFPAAPWLLRTLPDDSLHWDRDSKLPAFPVNSANKSLSFPLLMRTGFVEARKLVKIILSGIGRGARVDEGYVKIFRATGCPNRLDVWDRTVLVAYNWQSTWTSGHCFQVCSEEGHRLVMATAVIG